MKNVLVKILKISDEKNNQALVPTTYREKIKF